MKPKALPIDGIKNTAILPWMTRNLKGNGYAQKGLLVKTATPDKKRKECQKRITMSHKSRPMKL
jgi:hypothetical protein